MKISFFFILILISSIAFGSIEHTSATLEDIGIKKVKFQAIEDTEVVRVEVNYYKNMEKYKSRIYLIADESLLDCAFVYGNLMGENVAYLKSPFTNERIENAKVWGPNIIDLDIPGRDRMIFRVLKDGHSDINEIEFQFTNISFDEANDLIANSDTVKALRKLDPLNKIESMPKSSFVVIFDKDIIENIESMAQPLDSN